MNGRGTRDEKKRNSQKQKTTSQVNNMLLGSQPAALAVNKLILVPFTLHGNGLPPVTQRIHGEPVNIRKQTTWDWSARNSTKIRRKEEGIGNWSVYRNIA